MLPAVRAAGAASAAAGVRGPARSLSFATIAGARTGATRSTVTSTTTTVAGRAPTSSDPAGGTPAVQLVLYTGPQCSLCDDAKAVIASARQEAAQDQSAGVRSELTLVNIRDDSAPDVHRWRRAYQYDIPVLHMNGQEIMRHRIDKNKLVQAMREAAADK